MITSAWNTKRRMVPRWRSLSATLRSKELSAISNVPVGGGEQISPELGRRLEHWRFGPTLLTAAELVETAIVEKQEAEAIDAASALLSNFDSATPSIKRQAAELLVRAKHPEKVPTEWNPTPDLDLKGWRQRTRLYPHDPLAWVELALHYVIAREGEKAARCMRVALQLAPDNRHVLRSASRLFLHLNEPQHAHDLLVRSAATKRDPWLIAAEIAIAELAARGPRFYKQGIAMVHDGGIFPHQTSELAGSVGTAELIGGNRHKAKKMFRHSMIDPNGNALAQAEWATPNFGAELVPPARIQFVQDAFEAKALHRYREGKFGEVLQFCERWAGEEPYSIRPYEFGASTAGATDEFEKALSFARRGLRIRPGAPRLVNSAAFALASLNNVNEAEKILRTLSRGRDDKEALIAEANWGLVAFRKGDVEQGRQRYLAAIRGFEGLNAPSLVASARVYFAREALLAKTPDASELLAAARAAAEKPKNPNLLEVLERTEKSCATVDAKDRRPEGRPEVSVVT